MTIKYIPNNKFTYSRLTRENIFKLSSQWCEDIKSSSLNDIFFLVTGDGDVFPMNIDKS
ncbi:MAG: Unknown protein [uncultured Sulfurovum sp.]|uniref:Uncharacterized protein n=1 Tax=uncultured Sulfurovum sp. TaxID=269237 RepID=A0A6S6S6I7_9BACT|nr:MAG: Unknown protein [uncultured Sulfurovum sp.]